MKFSVDFGDDERGKLIARAYVAAVVGPLRRPNGRPTPFALTTASVQIAINNTQDRVMHVAVSLTSAALQALLFSNGANQGAQAQSLNFVTNHILYPSESLYVRTVAGNATISVVTETF